MARQKVNEKSASKTSDIMVKRRMSLRENKNTIGFSSAAREAYSQLKISRGYRENLSSSPFKDTV